MAPYIDSSYIQQNLKLPPKDSHKAQNGKLMIIGGSKLFHGSSLWAIKIASRIVDMVYYASVEENQALTQHLKSNLYAFINIPKGKESDYMAEADMILIGPGMVRGSEKYTGTGESGEQTREYVLNLLQQFPSKKWLIDAGALQVITVEDLKKLSNFIITPHRGEFEKLFQLPITNYPLRREASQLPIEELALKVQERAKEINGIIVLKGPVDIIASPNQVWLNKTGNAGMTKGGTGDVLAGLIAALACTHDLFTAAAIGTYINGLAGDELYQKVGPYFSADDLVNRVPEVLWQQVQS